jgi:hypothetical protein
MNDFLDQSSIDLEYKIINEFIYFLSKNKEITISLITGCFIYCRKLDYYKTLPRNNIKTTVVIIIWTYLSIIEPWFILIGLMILNLFGYKHTII